jgi:hypothetical protein
MTIRIQAHPMKAKRNLASGNFFHWGRSGVTSSGKKILPDLPTLTSN